jgi:hypothetical protein
MRPSSLSSPRDDRPGALVKIIERDLRDDLHRGNRTRQAEFPGDEQADHERVDRASDAPTDGLDERARVRLALRKEPHGLLPCLCPALGTAQPS